MTITTKWYSRARSIGVIFFFFFYFTRRDVATIQIAGRLDYRKGIHTTTAILILSIKIVIRNDITALSRYIRYHTANRQKYYIWNRKSENPSDDGRPTSNGSKLRRQRLRITRCVKCILVVKKKKFEEFFRKRDDGIVRFGGDSATGQTWKIVRTKANGDW